MSDPERLFAAALALPPTLRAEYLARCCRGDEALRREIEDLIRAHANADGFLLGDPEWSAGPEPGPSAE